MNSQLYPWLVTVLAILVAIGAGIVALGQEAPPSASGTGHEAATLLIHLQSDIKIGRASCRERV